MKYWFCLFIVILTHFNMEAQENYNPEEKLKALGITLQTPSSPIANYVNVVRVGNLLFLSGKGPQLSDGTYIKGKVGENLSIQQGYDAARWTGINQLAVLKAELGDLKKVKRTQKNGAQLNYGSSLNANISRIGGILFESHFIDEPENCVN